MRSKLLLLLFILLTACGRKTQTQSTTDDENLPPLSPILYDQLTAVGNFQINSPFVIITDPGYDLKTARVVGLGVVFTNCLEGNWKLLGSENHPPEVAFRESDEMLAHSEHLPSSLLSEIQWEEHAAIIGGDYAMIGIYDLKHFHDDAVIPKDQKWTFDGKPADPRHLWYSMNCESRPLPPFKGFGPAVIPNGCVLHWDGGVRVIVGRGTDGKIKAIRFVAV